MYNEKQSWGLEKRAKKAKQKKKEKQGTKAAYY